MNLLMILATVVIIDYEGFGWFSLGRLSLLRRELLLVLILLFLGKDAAFLSHDIAFDGCTPGLHVGIGACADILSDISGLLAETS